MTAYPESDALVGLAQSVWAGSKEAARVNFALSDRLKAELKRLLDKDIGEAFITDSEARHIRKNHGQNEAARGQADITPGDFSLIPIVMNEFDTAEHTDTDPKGNRKVLFTKKVDGMVYMASVERGAKKMCVITLWKVPGKGA